LAASETQLAELSFDGDKQLYLSHLLSANWWTGAFQLVFKLMRHFVLVAFLFAWSNAFTAYADYSLSHCNLDFASTEIDLPALTNLGAKLAFATVVALILGLLSLSMWLEKLTALARLALLERMPADYKDTKREVDLKKGYIAAVWMVAVIFLLVPLIPASVCMAFKILANSQLYAMGEPLIVIPEVARLPMNLAESLLFSISMAYCLVLAVISSALSIAPAKAAKFSARLMLNQAGRLMIATFFVVLLNALLSAPMSIYLAYLAPAEQKKDLLLIIVSQLWFGLSSALAWPLSMLIFVEMLKKNFSISTQQEQSFSSSENSAE
jgi:hypothetical protein